MGERPPPDLSTAPPGPSWIVSVSISIHKTTTRSYMTVTYWPRYGVKGQIYAENKITFRTPPESVNDALVMLISAIPDHQWWCDWMAQRQVDE